MHLLFRTIALVMTCGVGVAHAGPLEDGSAAAKRADFTQAIQSWRPLANPSNALTFKNERLPANLAEALGRFRGLAEGGDAGAQYLLGLLYNYSPTERDQVASTNGTEALRWFQKAAELALPILLPLRAVLDATPSGHLTYLVTERGKPFTAPGFGNKFRDWCNEAGLPQCSAHGIRKHAAVIAAENGATEHQLMAMFGWDSPKQAAVYTRKANRTKLAKSAMHLLVSENENKKV